MLDNREIKEYRWIFDGDDRTCIHEKDPSSKSGYKVVWKCPIYQTWRGLAYRVKSKTNSAYADVDVFEDWLLFSNFKAWMETKTYLGLELDKDILVPGSKIYSPDTCEFVPYYVNTIFHVHKTHNSLMGTFYRGRKNECSIRKEKIKHWIGRGGRDGVSSRGGYFYTEMEAHRAWQFYKINTITGNYHKYRSSEHYLETIGAAIRLRLDHLIFQYENNLVTNSLAELGIGWKPDEHD